MKPLYVRLFRAVAILAICLFTRPIPATSAVTPPDGGADSVQSQILRILDSPALAEAHVGVHVISLDDSTILADIHGSKLFIPASTLKLVTSAAALSILTTEYEFPTTLAGRVSSRGAIEGDLIVRGSGDPLFTTDQIDSLLSQLRAEGITRITGDLVGDISAYDTTAWGSGWMWDDEPGGYQPFLSSLALNRNCLRIVISPGRIAGQPARHQLLDPSPFVDVTNRTITSSDSTLPPLRFDRDRETNAIVISGRVDPADDPDTSTVSIFSPDLFFLRMLERRLPAFGIAFSGSLRLDTMGSGPELARVTHTCGSILRLTNKESDNFAAEQLLRALSRHAGEKRASAGSGIHHLLVWLQGLGIDTTRISIADGSGLSKYSMVSPRQLTGVLYHEYRHERQFSVFFNALPVGGVDGTLARRFQATEAEGRVHAKTGTMSGVSSLAGYVLSADGHPLAFAIISNMFAGKARPVKQIEDSIVRLLSRLTIGTK